MSNHTCTGRDSHTCQCDIGRDHSETEHWSRMQAESAREMVAQKDVTETIQAAIDKLERLRDESTPKPWHYWTDDLNGDVDLWHDQEQRLWIGNLGQHENARVYRDADLIVTLHRTIDAQLAILRNSYGGAQDVDRYGWSSADSPDAVADALDLARAIIGEEVPA